MVEYEILYLISDTKKKEIDAISTSVTNIVTASGGVLSGSKKILERKMSYAISHVVRGIYTAERFMLPGADDKEYNVDINPISEITRKLNLNSNILRFIIVRADELPPLTNDTTTEEKLVDKITNDTASSQSEMKKVRVSKTKALSVTQKDEQSVHTNRRQTSRTKKGSLDIDKKLEEILNL